MDSTETYRDYTYIMYILCYQTSLYYSRIKNIINIPILICSTCLSIINTPEFNNDMEKMMIVKYVSTAFNLVIALLVAMLNLYKITEKEFSFQSHASNFLKLHNRINSEIAKSRNLLIDVEILAIIDEYNLLCEYISFHIPAHIKKKIIKNHKTSKMPTILVDVEPQRIASVTQIKESMPKQNSRSSPPQARHQPSLLQLQHIQQHLSSHENTDVFIEVSPHSSLSEQSYVSLNFLPPAFTDLPYKMNYSPIRGLHHGKQLKIHKHIKPPQ